MLEHTFTIDGNIVAGGVRAVDFFTNYVNYSWWVFMQVPTASVVNVRLYDKNT